MSINSLRVKNYDNFYHYIENYNIFGKNIKYLGLFFCDFVSYTKTTEYCKIFNLCIV